MKLFRLGRLQFCMAVSVQDIPKYGIKKGDNVMEIHIPSGENLDIEECKRSIEDAKKFFAEYFPEFKYSVFTCYSWLLDDTLKKYLPEQSRILQFGNMFDKIMREERLDLIKYIFSYDTTITNIKCRYPISSFAAKIQKAVLAGEKFFEVLGVIEKD
jgi:hypothetical protein